jgi:small subunit ribosomal protein S17
MSEQAELSEQSEVNEQTETTAADEQRRLRKIRTGQVVGGETMDKTVVVSVIDLKQHPVYKKVVRRNTKYKAHDERNECHVGDRVRIMETRPISKQKRWRVVEIVEKAR